MRCSSVCFLPPCENVSKEYQRKMLQDVNQSIMATNDTLWGPARSVWTEPHDVDVCQCMHSCTSDVFARARLCSCGVPFVHCVVFSRKPEISELWNHLRQHYFLWAFNKAVVFIQASENQDRSLEHLGKCLSELFWKLPQSFHTSLRLDSGPQTTTSLYIYTWEF